MDFTVCEVRITFNHALPMLADLLCSVVKQVS